MASSDSTHLMQVVAASGREVLISIAASVQQELHQALDRGEFVAADVYWRAMRRCSVADGAQWSLPPLAALTLCSSIAAACISNPNLEPYRSEITQQSEVMLAAHCSPPAAPRLQVADLSKVVKGTQLSPRQVGFMPGFLLVFGGKGDGVRLYPSRCMLSEKIRTEDTVEIEYIDDDKPTTKQVISLRAATSSAASAVHAAIRDIRHGCSGAASQFGECWDALVVASALHAVMDSPDSLARIKTHLFSSRLFNKLDLDSLCPPKPEGLLYVARGLAWRSLQLPLAAVCDFTWTLTFSKRGDKSRIAVQRERVVQLRRLCGHIIDALKETDSVAAAGPRKSWASNWNATRDLKLGVLAVALQWIRKEIAELKRAPPPPITSTPRTSLGSSERTGLADDQISVASNSTRGPGGSDTASLAASLASETPALSPGVSSHELSPGHSASAPALFQTSKRPGLTKLASLGEADDAFDGSLPSAEGIIAFLTGSGVAISDYDLFETSDANARSALDRSRVETVKLAKYHEVRSWWESKKDESGGEMRLSGMKVTSLAGWSWEGTMSRITCLYLDGNKLKEFSWDWVVLLPCLELLSLENNFIERIIAFLSKDSCKNLVSLRFGGNKLAKLSSLTETIDPSVGARITTVSLFGNPFIASLRDEGAGGCDVITAEYTYISSILAFFPRLSHIDGFELRDAHFWWVKVLSEFNSGAAALCQAMHPCQSTRTLALAPLLSWACAPVACACFATLDGVSAVLPMFRYITDPRTVFCGLMVMRRITAGTNSSSASGLCSASLAPLFWSVLKRASEEFPDLNNNQYTQPSPTSFWSPAWAICIGVLALQVLADATFHLSLSASSPPPQVLLAAFARSAATTLPNVLAAIAEIFGKGGKVYRSIGFLEGPPDLEQAISAIWGKASVEEKWIKGVVGLPPLNEGLSASISASPQNSPSAKTHPVSDSSSPSSDKCFSHSDALASASYFNRMSRTTSTSAHRRSSLLSSQYSGSLMQSVSKLAKVPDELASTSAGGAAGRSPSDSAHALVKLSDCASSIYDCCVALLGVASEECKSMSVHSIQSACSSILSAWRADYESGQLREGDGRYGMEFAIMMELMSQIGNEGTKSGCVSGSDVVAVGYVSAAAARSCLSHLICGSSSKHQLQFRAVLSTFFRALFLCDDSPSSADALRDTASRNGLELPVSSTFIKSCLGVNGKPSAPDDLKAELLRHLNSCFAAHDSTKMAQMFLEQVLGCGNQEHQDIDALVSIASAIVERNVASGSTFAPHLTYWIFGSLARVAFSSVSQKSGSPNDAAVAAVSSLCRHALFETTDVDLCAHCLTLLHHWMNPPPSTPPFQLMAFLSQPLPPLTIVCSVLQRAPPSQALSLSSAVTAFFANVYAVPELPNRGLHLLLETLKSVHGEHRHTLSAIDAQSGLEFSSVIGAIMQASPLGASSVRLASELCVRWDVRCSSDVSLSTVVLCRSAEVEAVAAAAAARAAASGNQRDFEDAYDLQCCSFLIHARHASGADTKLFESVLKTFLGFTGSPSPSLLTMTCLASCLVLDSYSSPAAPDHSKSHSSDFASGLSRIKQLELVSDAIMALLRACRAGSDDIVLVDAKNEPLTISLNIVRSIAAKLALKVSRIDMTAMQKLLLNDTLVPFLSGLSSSKVGGGFGDGVDTATVAVINEICERALLSDVAAAIAAARAIAAVTEQCLSAGQSELASRAMSSLPLLLAKLVFSSVPHQSLKSLTATCGATFKNVLKVMCNIGRATNASLDNLWKLTFECVSVVLCLEPLLASPALVFASATAFVPPAAPLMIAVLKEDFLPIAMSAVGLSRLIPWRLDDLSQAITCLLITNGSSPAPPPIWWKRAMDSLTSNLRTNAAHLFSENCPPCIATAASVCLALTRVKSVDSLAQEATRIVAFLNSATFFIKTVLLAVPLHSSDSDATSSSPNAMYPWFIEFIVLMSHIFELVALKSSVLFMSFIAREGKSCIADFVSVLCRMLRDHCFDDAITEQIQDVVTICCQSYTVSLSVAADMSPSASATLDLLSDLWWHACDGASKAQRPALLCIATAVSQQGPEIITDLAANETNLKAIIQIIVSHIEVLKSQSATAAADTRSFAVEAACQVLSACVKVKPSLSATIVSPHILRHLCASGWTWARSAVAPSVVESITSMVISPLRPAVAQFASHIFGEVLQLKNASPWLALVVTLMETNASHVCDLFTDDIAAAAAGENCDPSDYATRLLQYATICSLCGEAQVSDEVETAFGFGMGILFDDAWKALPASCDNLIAQRNHLHALFLSRHVMSQTAVSAAAFAELLEGALKPTDGGCFALLSLIMLLCPCEEHAIENGDIRLEHVKFPDDFSERFMNSLESSMTSETTGRALQISILFRVGVTLNWHSQNEVEWKHRAVMYYAVALTSNGSMQHVLLQTISEVVLSCVNPLPASLCNALVIRTHQLRSDLLTDFGPNLLLQIGSCLKNGFVTLSSIKVLLVNVISATDDESHLNLLITRTLVLALAAASAVDPSVFASEFPDAASVCRSSQRHVLRFLSAADAQGVFDVEVFQSVQLLCRLGASDTLIEEGLFAHILRSFDTGIDLVALKCILMSLWHAFAPEYAGDAWFRCRLIVLRILLHSNFSGLLAQRDTVAALADILTNTISIDNWICLEVMSNIAIVLSSALQYHSVDLIRDFFDVLLKCVPKVDPSHWCKEFVVITSRCCGCDYSLPDSPSLCLSACRVILAISEQNVSVVASSDVVCHLIAALSPCSTNSDSMALLVRTMLTVASASPMLLVDQFPSALLSISLDIMDTLSVDAIHCVVQLMFALSSASNSARTQFVEIGAMKFLHFSMQKYSIKDDDSSLSICLLLSQLMLKLSLPSDAVEVSSAFLLLLHSWHDKVKQKPSSVESGVFADSSLNHRAHLVDAAELFSSMEQKVAHVDLKISALESNQTEFNELLKSVSKFSDVKALFDSLLQHQQDSLLQQQQESICHWQQQQQQMQLHQSLLQQQQQLLEHQQQQLFQQQLQLEQIALRQQSCVVPAFNHDELVATAPPMSVLLPPVMSMEASAPPESVERDE